MIAGYAELLEVRGDDGFRREAALHIGRAAHVLGTTIDDLLVVLALDEGEVVVDPVPLDVRGSLEVALAEAKVEEGRASVVDGSAVAQVLADPEHLQRILRGILSHTLGRSLSRAITIAMEQRDQMVITRVCVDGPSLPADRLGTLFDRLSEIGLYNARRLAELQGGEVWAEDGGRVLAFALPAATP